MPSEREEGPARAGGSYVASGSFAGREEAITARGGRGARGEVCDRRGGGEGQPGGEGDGRLDADRSARANDRIRREARSREGTHSIALFAMRSPNANAGAAMHRYMMFFAIAGFTCAFRMLISRASTRPGCADGASSLLTDDDREPAPRAAEYRCQCSTLLLLHAVHFGGE